MKKISSVINIQRGYNSQISGENFENRIAKEGAERANQSGGDQVADVENTPFWLELKKSRAPNIHKAVIQARRATDGRPITIISQRDDDPVLVTMEIDTWKKLLTHHNFKLPEKDTDPTIHTYDEFWEDE